LGPLGTAATKRPIVPAPGDYDDGEIVGMIGRGNRSTRRKPAQCRLVHHRPRMLLGREPGSPRWKPATNSRQGQPIRYVAIAVTPTVMFA
jgi:hypothetical protein